MSVPVVLDERVPLLSEQKDVDEEKVTPLPRVQMTILLFLQLAEPIASQCILPFINQLISELDITGGDETKVGYYSGLVISLFFATEALFVFQWSRLSDHIGRKPVLLIGLFGTGVSMICFGLSKTFWTVVISRCLTGLLNGNVGVMKSMLAEITDSTNIAQGFSLIPVVWSFGSAIGPVIGGTLSNPHQRLRGFEGAFWEKYPYFLPCCVSAAYAAFAFIVVSAFLKETVNRHAKSNAISPPSYHDFDVKETSEPPVPLRKLLVYPVIITVANYTALSFGDIAMWALLPLFYSTPIELGGLGLGPSTIGLLLGAFGISNGMFQFFFFAKLVKRWGAKNLFVTGISALIPIYLMFPVINLLAGRFGMSPIVWAAITLQLLVAIIMDMAFGSIFIFLSSAAPNKRCLGAVNGFAQTNVSTIRAIGPAAAASLFSISLRENWLGGYAVYLLLVFTSLLTLILAGRLPKKPWKKA